MLFSCTVSLLIVFLDAQHFHKCTKVHWDKQDQRCDPFNQSFRAEVENFSVGVEGIFLKLKLCRFDRTDLFTVLDRNFREFWSKESRPFNYNQISPIH